MRPFRLECLLDERLKLRLGHGPHPLVHDRPVLEKNDGRNPANSVFTRDGGIVIDVHLADLDLTVVILGYGVDHWSDGLAGGAPGSPKIDEHGKPRLQYFGIEIIVSECEHLIAGHQISPFGTIQIDIKITIKYIRTIKKIKG